MKPTPESVVPRFCCGSGAAYRQRWAEDNEVSSTGIVLERQGEENNG